MATSAPDFVHLHVHSHFSLLDGACKVEELAKAAARDGQKAIALTDHGNLFGAIPFFKACKKEGVRPVLGIEAYLAGKSRLQKGNKTDNPTYHLTLLARNLEGWKNLMKLSSLSYKEGFYRKPRMDKEILAQYGKGLIALSGCLAGELNRTLERDDIEKAVQAAGTYQDIFGKENYFLEIMDTGFGGQEPATLRMKELQKRSQIPLVVTNDVHYLQPSDSKAQDILLCICTGKTVHEENRFRMDDLDLYFRTRQQMAELFPNDHEALYRSAEIAERCEVDLDFETYHLPIFTPESGETPEQMFDRLCEEGARRRYGEITPQVRERLEYEKGIIKKLGFVSYFLIVWDFIRFGRENDVPVGPGRGSAAGSIVAYCLRITELDPLKYNLLFERFLNAQRISMPDIDIDFCRDKREKVIEYVREKYGEENVSQIITFGTMASRGVIRDVGRALAIPLGEVDRIAKKIPQGPGASLKDALDTDQELKEIRGSSPEISKLFDIGVRLEGLCRHSSTHAAGVVISDKPLDEYVPLYKKGDDITTQWQMTDLEDIGLLKMDFLGLKTLTIIQEALDLIQDTHGVRIDFDGMGLDDPATYALLQAGETQGVFQLESDGMRELLVRLRPDHFEDIIAVLALYRPGPLQSGMVDMYVKRKHGEEPVIFPHECLAEILEDTHGVIVYQEQVMLIANTMAGFSLNEADSLRKAMGKKKPEVMEKFRGKFVEGAIKKGYPKKVANEIFSTMEFFAGYGFNKSHSAAYALLTYRMAWLKANYPSELLCSLMTCDMGVTDKVKDFVEEAGKMGIEVLPPNINKSKAKFSLEHGAIRYGLGALKGLGEKAADFLVMEREKNGPFADLNELSERWDAAVVNKTAFETLAKAGAFDSSGWTRRAVFETIPEALRDAAQFASDRQRGQTLLFEMASSTQQKRQKPSLPEWPEREKLAFEKEALGFYLSGHPFERRGRFFSRLAGTETNKLAKLREKGEKDSILLAGMITSIRIMTIKSGRNAGQKMAKFRLEDLQGSVQVTVFSKTYIEVKEQIIEDALVFLRARIDQGSEEPALLADEIIPAERFVRQAVDGLVLCLEENKHDQATLDRIAEVVSKKPGNQRLLFELKTAKGERFRLQAGRQFRITLDDDLLDECAKIVGSRGLSFTRR
jgi:DNA polymerase-3 subunit alpha